MAVSAYELFMANWSPEQDGVTDDRDIITIQTLAATGAGNWTVLDTNRTIRLGAFAFEAGVTHTFRVGGIDSILQTGADLSYRIRDVTNSLTIASFALSSLFPTGIGFAPVYPSTSTFSNLPSGDALIEFQYELIAPSTGAWFSAVWQVSRAV